MPIGTIIGKDVTRGSICKDRYRAEVLIMCSSRVPLSQPSPMSVEIKWRQRRDGRELSAHPQSAPVTLTMRSLTQPPHGIIRFDRPDGPEQKGFDGDAREIVTIHGQGATVGAAPDIALEVRIDGEVRDTIPMSVGAPTTAVAIKAENGTSDPPAFVLAEEHTRLKAVVAPAAGGTFRWLTFAPAVLEILGGAQTDQVEVVAHRAAGAAPPEGMRLHVLFTAQGANPSSVLATHSMSVAVDLERLFTEHVLHPRHLEDASFLRRLEAMRPPEVQLFIERASAPPLANYLARLLEFVNGQEPLRAAPAGDRPSITFIMGDEEPTGAPNRFYASAIAHFTLHPAGQLVTDQRTLIDVRDYLAANRPPGGLRWGEINIVVHANEEGGMTIPVRPLEPDEDPGAHEVNVNTLTEAVNGDAFRPLPDDLVDVRTVVRIRGCALGRSQPMLSLLSAAFGGRDAQRPVVRAPRHLQAYHFEFQDTESNLTSSEEYLIEFWFIGFPQGQRPTNPDIVARFEHDFPGVNVNWASALAHPGVPSGASPTTETRTREYQHELERHYFPTPSDDAALAQILAQTNNPSFAGASGVHITRRAPAPDGTTTITFDFVNADGNDVPGNVIEGFLTPPANDAGRMALLRRQQSIISDLAGVGHTINDYTWTFRQTDAAAGGGQRVMNLTFIGRRTILRVERELREPDPAHPATTQRVHPTVTDLAHFGEEVPVREPSHPLGENVPVREPEHPAGENVTP